MFQVVNAEIEEIAGEQVVESANGGIVPQILGYPADTD